MLRCVSAQLDAKNAAGLLDLITGFGFSIVAMFFPGSLSAGTLRLIF